MPPKDEVFPAEEQPLPAAVSPTTNSPGYIADSDPEEDEEDPEEDPTDYPADGGDDGDDDDESSDDDEDDNDDIKEDEDEEEEEEHPSPADSVPPPVHRVTARMYVRAQTPVSLPSDTEVTILLAIPTPPPSPLSPLPSPLPHILSPLPQILSPPSPRYEVGESSSTPTARPTGGFRADYGFVGTLDDEIRRDPERYVGYGIADTWDEMVEDMQGTPATTHVARLSQRMTDFVTTVRQDIDEIYVRLDDAHDKRLLMSGQLNMLGRDRHAHARIARLMETEARLSRKAWVQSIDASDTARSEVRALRTTVLAQQTEITRLRAADRTRQAQLVETLTLLRTLQTQAMYVSRLYMEGMYYAMPVIEFIMNECRFKNDTKRTTRSTPAATTTTTTTITDAQLKALIDQGVDNALAARDADRS
ncbi:hypothetical protein Tco_0571781 [Tanacetum coccineum]